MKRHTLLLALPLAALGAFALAQETPAPEETPAAEAPAFENDQQRYSYALGVNVGESLKREGVELEMGAFARGVSDAMAGTSAMDPQQIQELLMKLQQELQANAQKRQAALAETNKTEGAAFLAEVEKREGVTKTASGLCYEVVEAGDGPSPTASSQVTVHYSGTLIDGTKFDSSYDRGQPATFPVDGVIAGWTEALQLMKVGAKWKLYIPSDLAYGMNPRPGGPIGPNAVLVFEVELLKVE
jgi:FKBP-type peptidyl-prolyl cis-trans isomerase